MKHYMSNFFLAKHIGAEMLEFLESTPLSPDLVWTKDEDFLRHFEAERHLLVRDMLYRMGIGANRDFEMLDFGYLHGLTQEFLHRAFPGARITVCDRPSSPVFSDEKYSAAIRQRSYLNLVPRDISDLDGLEAKYQVIMLGEIIEHLDPTQVARCLSKLRTLILPGGALIITTPNASGLYNCYMTMTGGDEIQSPPIPSATHGYPHIHLWSPSILRKTAEQCGWKFNEISFYHGREAEKFEEIKSSWHSLKSQIFIRAIRFLANRKPNLRGFFIASFTA